MRELREAATALAERWTKDSFPLGDQKYDDRRRELAKCASQLCATIARVEALPAKWRAAACPGIGDVNVMPDKTECADELETALKDV